ncbi:hypothetical protein M413DRAFT_20959 [Hebeloma cylindrosporum]|uniref:Uncharacterized protein n=1 Tax=Hebeloma cylindrosporum TaxID=76867 RepID=A0A0C2Z626_HEBCY|nr:hypothetical protein M413DRAFT_20959 [Hebeloma cylindrosporum h7]
MARSLFKFSIHSASSDFKLHLLHLRLRHSKALYLGPRISLLLSDHNLVTTKEATALNTTEKTCTVYLALSLDTLSMFNLAFHTVSVVDVAFSSVRTFQERNYKDLEQLNPIPKTTRAWHPGAPLTEISGMVSECSLGFRK